MFWNNDFLDPLPSHIDVLLQRQTVKLSDILFEDDLLQELKTSNVILVNFLSRSDIIAELVENITQLTEKDCCDKLLYSRVHAAYISCEILTSGSSEVFAALMNHPESLTKIISCLTKQLQPEKEEAKDEQQPQLLQPELQQPDQEQPDQKQSEEPKPEQQQNGIEKVAEQDDEQNERQQQDQVEQKQQEQQEQDKVEEEAKHDHSDEKKEQHDVDEERHEEKENHVDGLVQMKDIQQDVSTNNNSVEAQPPPPLTFVEATKVVPQKATLVSKLISTVHSLAPEKLSCHITQDIGSFSKLINLLVQNIDISGACEILNIFIKKTTPPEYRYIFCEILSKLRFVYSLIEVMTLSDVEDKQRNACLLLCDIIVIGRQEASDQTNSGPMAQDMLAELLESSQAVHVILDQMFSDNMRNTTAIVCGMKVLQRLLERKSASDGELLAKTIQQTQEEIEKHLIKFHELLLNPPKQQPIKTTFGIIQKPLGYMRLEVVNLIRALISTNSPNIIRKLVDLRTMKVIIDLFIEYSWNNLLHTQVEQALCLIINNYRRDEELNYHIDVQQHSHLNNHQNEKLLAEALDNKMTEGDTVKLEEQENQENLSTLEQQQSRLEQSVTEIPSRALLSQLLNECDLIGRLLLPGSVTISGEQANFGHIIQMINSIAINRDLDTIKDHLNEMKDKRPELYDRWTTFVNVDVASFKEISLYYDAQSANNNVNHRYGHQFPNNQHLTPSNSPQYNDVGNVNEDQFWAFVEESVIPKINVDVFPRLRRSNNHQTMYKKSSQQ